MIFKITLLVMFIITVFGLFYYVSWSERVEDIKEKERNNRKAFFAYRQKIEEDRFRKLMKERYNIEVEEDFYA